MEPDRQKHAMGQTDHASVYAYMSLVYRFSLIKISANKMNTYFAVNRNKNK